MPSRWASAITVSMPTAGPAAPPRCCATGRAPRARSSVPGTAHPRLRACRSCHHRAGWRARCRRRSCWRQCCRRSRRRRRMGLNADPGWRTAETRAVVRRVLVVAAADQRAHLAGRRVERDEQPLQIVERPWHAPPASGDAYPGCASTDRGAIGQRRNRRRAGAPDRVSCTAGSRPRRPECPRAAPRARTASTKYGAGLRAPSGGLSPAAARFAAAAASARDQPLIRHQAQHEIAPAARPVGVADRIVVRRADRGSAARVAASARVNRRRSCRNSGAPRHRRRTTRGRTESG